MKRGSIALMSLVVSLQLTSPARAQGCYPGLDCSRWAELPAARVLAIGPIVQDFFLTDRFVVDRSQRLIWSRNVYLLGSTRELLQASSSDRMLERETYAHIRELAARLEIAGIHGWRLPSSGEMEYLLTQLAPTTIGTYFALGAPVDLNSLLALHDFDGQRDTVPLDGVLYTNTSRGRASGHLGDVKSNRFGVWLVKAQPSAAVPGVVTPLRDVVELIEEQQLKPLEVRAVRKAAGGTPSPIGMSQFPTASNAAKAETRYFALYDFGRLKSNAIVSSVEIILRGRRFDPLQTIAIHIGERNVPATATDEVLWDLFRATKVGVWQMPGNARLELPGHIIRNATALQERVWVAVSVDAGACEFETPELVIRFVSQ